MFALPEKEFYSVKEIAVIFGCHHTTIRRAVKLGFIVAIRLGNGKRSPYRISKQSIEKIHQTIILMHNQKSKKI